MTNLNFFKVSVLAAFVALTGCNEMDGVLKANETLSLKKGKKTVLIPAGQYITEVEADGDDQVEVKIRLNKDKSEKFEFMVPKDSFKEKTFRIPAEVTGQIYSLAGVRDEEVTRSELRRDWESCSYDDYITRCATDNQGRTRCWSERITRWGQRWVEYIDETTVYSLEAQLLTAQETVAADFSGERTITERLYRNVGYCR